MNTVKLLTLPPTTLNAEGDKRPLMGKSLHNCTPTEYRTLIKSYYEEPPKTTTSPTPGVNVRLNDKGTIIVTIRDRKPKYITYEELTHWRKELGIKESALWAKCTEKSITVKRESKNQEGSN